MSCLGRLKNGDYLAMFHDDGRFLRDRGERKPPITLYKTRSSDGGLTWSEPEVVARFSLD